MKVNTTRLLLYLDFDSLLSSSLSQSVDFVYVNKLGRPTQARVFIDSPILATFKTYQVKVVYAFQAYFMLKIHLKYSSKLESTILVHISNMAKLAMWWFYILKLVAFLTLSMFLLIQGLFSGIRLCSKITLADQI